jgi:hypothetical protein
MNEFNGTDLSKAFNTGVDAVALECNKRIVAELPAPLENSQYWKGYRDALRELLEWMDGIRYEG